MTQESDAILKALAHPLRRQILEWLKDPSGNFSPHTYLYPHGVCAGQIVLRSTLAQSTVSTHLAMLQRAGLLVGRRVGQNHFFRRNEQVIAKFMIELRKELLIEQGPDCQEDNVAH